MIIEWIWAQLCAFVGWFVGLFPTVTVPDWVGGLSGYLTDGVAYANGMHMWIPLEALGNSLAFLLGCGAVVLVVRGAIFVMNLVRGSGAG